VANARFWFAPCRIAHAHTQTQPVPGDSAGKPLTSRNNVGPFSARFVPYSVFRILDRSYGIRCEKREYGRIVQPCTEVRKFGAAVCRRRWYGGGKKKDFHTFPQTSAPAAVRKLLLLIAFVIYPEITTSEEEFVSSGCALAGRCVCLSHPACTTSIL
jgi:hypothetical protein